MGYSWGITGEGESVFSPINAVFSELFPGLSELERHNSVVHLCGRTQEVLDGILAVAGQGVTCEEATGRDLASVTDLDLRNRGIDTLKSSDFFGLPNLRRIDLSGNRLSSLPDDIFSRAPENLEVYLYDNDSSEGLITPADVQNLLPHLPHSTVLYLDGGDASQSGFGSSEYEFREGGFMTLDINLGGERPLDHQTILGRISFTPATAELNDIPVGAFQFTLEGRGTAFLPPRLSSAYLAPPLPDDFDVEGDEKFIVGIEVRI